MLRWEVEWQYEKFKITRGNLKVFCEKKNIDLKLFKSVKDLNSAISTNYSTEKRKHSGLFWFFYDGAKPKGLLYNLRNCFAHGHFKQCTRNKILCVEIECIHNGKIKAIGHIPLDELQSFVKAAASCRVD